MTEIIRTPIAAFTWQTADFAWNSDDAGKTWATSYQYAYQCNINETIGISDSIRKILHLKLNEVLSAVDNIQKNVSIIKHENLSLSDNNEKVFSMSKKLAESIQIDDVAGKGVSVKKQEAFSIQDDSSKSIFIFKNESLGIADDAALSNHFFRSFSELLSVAESASKEIGLNKSESFSLTDEWIRNANAIISDFLIKSGEITEEEFATYLARGSAVGYNNFVTFVPGYYQFQNAIIRYFLNAKTTDRPQIKHLDAIVDMPDIIDRGYLNTVDTGLTTVSFARVFTIIPEVIPAQTGGTTVGTVEIANVSKTSFDVGLKDGSSYIVGKISWIAHGY